MIEAGLVVGNFTILSELRERRNRKIVVRCRCICGKLKSVVLSAIRSGNTRSCGCKKIEAATTHGRSKKPEYSAWKHMLRRCYNPENRAYRWYGGRGIKVSDEWRSSFRNFFDDMGIRPSGQTIDRIDNNGPYSKENCRWADWFVQSRNKRSNRHITAFGKTQVAADWCVESGLKTQTFGKRLRSGWPMEKIMTTPLKGCEPGLPEPEWSKRRKVSK